MTEQELLLDCLRRLNDCGIPYFLTVSMASNYWGIPRTTHDLDFVIDLQAESVGPLVQAFAGDYFVQESSARAALQPPHQFNALDQRSALKVDFWVLKDEPFEKEVFARRRAVSLFGTPAWIASAEDVVLSKLSWNRTTPSERQLLDAAGIWAVQKHRLDQDYLSRWASRLKIEDTLEQLRRG